jgi:hypothetical protein
MKFLSMIILSFSLSSVFAHEVTVKISLSPAGGFEAKSAKLKGEVKKVGSQFTAENLWVKIEELETGISLRDEHFHKHLNLKNFQKSLYLKLLQQKGRGQVR